MRERAVRVGQVLALLAVAERDACRPFAVQRLLERLLQAAGQLLQAAGALDVRVDGDEHDAVVGPARR